MSGGSFDYFYEKVMEARDTIDNRGHTKFGQLLKQLLDSLVPIMHVIEWWYSGDTGEEDFVIECIKKADGLKEIGNEWSEEAQEIFRLAANLRLEKDEMK